MPQEDLTNIVTQLFDARIDHKRIVAVGGRLSKSAFCNYCAPYKLLSDEINPVPIATGNPAVNRSDNVST